MITRTYALLGCRFIIAGVMLFSFSSSVSAGTILGSIHDFSERGWSNGEICVVCHTPHNAHLVQDAPLWNHKLTESQFATYSSPTFDGGNTIGQPSGASVMCLSCHDGTVALDSFGGGAGTTRLTDESRNLGSDLSNDHPISFTFDAALALADPGLYDPTVKVTTIGSGEKTKTGTIADVMLFNNKLQCPSCHDVHNGFTSGIPGDPLLRITKQRSTLCLTCHDK